MNMKSNQNFKVLNRESTSYILTIIRILIGWHFLYEGIVKLLNPSWSAGTYLLESTWIFSGIFRAMALNLKILQIVDFINVWGLILIGLFLFIGLFTRIAAWSGAG